MHRATQVSLVLAVGALAAVLVTQDGPGPASAGGHGWVFDHESRGILQGRVTCDPDIPPTHVRVGLWFDGAEGGQRYAGALAADGSFLFDPVPTGVGRVALWVEDESDPLLVVEDVRVGDGRIDPRLYKLSLVGQLSCFEIDVLDPLGAPVPRALVGWRPAQDGDYEHTVEAQDGRATIVSSHELVDVLVQASGLRTEEVPGIAFDTEVALREGIAVIVEPPAEAFVEGDVFTLEALPVFEGRDPRLGRANGRSAEFLKKHMRAVPVVDGVARLALPLPGSWRVEWRVVYPDDRWERLGDDASDARIDVAASYYEQRFRPAFPLSDLRAERAR